MRELVPMAKARNQAEWLRAGVMVGWIRGVSPWKVIPRCYHPEFQERRLSPEQEEIEADRSWKALDAFMIGLGAQNGGAGR